MKISEIENSNISNMNKNEVNQMLEKIYPIYQIAQIENLEIVLNKKTDSKHEKIIEEFKKIYKERDEIIGHLEKEKNSSIYEEITSSMGGNIRSETLFKIFTNNEKFHYISLNLYKNEDNSKFIIDNHLYYNIKFSIKRQKNKYLPYYFEGDKYVDFYYKEFMNNLPKIYINLETNGNAIFHYAYPSYKMIQIYYFLNILFEEVYLLFRNIIVCKKFKNDIKHLKYITEIIQNNYEFSFTKDIQLDSIFAYLKYHIQYDLFFKYQLIIKKNKKMYNLYWLSLSNLLKELQIELPKKNEKKINKMKTILNIDIKHSYLNKILKIKNINEVLSIGFSNDIYEYKKQLNPKMKLLFILNELNSKKEIKDVDILKTNQNDIFNLLIQLSIQNKKFNYIFMNMILDFNQTLYYSMFVNKLLRPNGYFIIKNTHFDEINQCVIHIEKTLKYFKKKTNLGNIVIFEYVE